MINVGYSTQPVAQPDVLERHFTAQQLACAWSLDESTIRRMFQDEPGVLKIGKSARQDGKRDYMTLRIPESVARRVHRERTGGFVQSLDSRKRPPRSPARTALSLMRTEGRAGCAN